MTQHDTSGDSPAHDTGTGKGEEKGSSEGQESGRHDLDTSHAGRPAGGTMARDSTGVNPDEHEPIDPKMPNMPPA